METSTALNGFAVRVLRQWGADADRGAAFTELRRLIILSELGDSRPLELFCRSGKLREREIQQEMVDYLRDRLDALRLRQGRGDWCI